MQKVRLGDVCTKGSSNIAQKDLEKKSGIYPIYGASGFIKNVDFYKQENEYIALVKDGAGVGRVMKCPEKSSVIGTMQYIFPNDNINISFLAYVLEKMDLSKFCSGATIPHIYFKDYCNQTFLLPSLEQQQQIVSVLDKISLLIDKRKKQLTKLDELVKSRFVEMFGDPVENDKGLSVKTLKQLSTVITNGNTPKGGSENYVDEGILFLRSQNVWRNRIELDDVAYIDETTHRSMRKSSLKHKDILITKTGRINTENSSLGRAALYLGKDDLANINGHVYLVRLDGSVIPEYVVSILTSEAYRKYIRKVCVGGIDKRQINLDQVENFPIILPPLALQREFAAFVEKVDKMAFKAKASLEKLETLKQAQMQKYFG